MASRIEVIATDLGVTVDGESIAAGEVLQRAGNFRVAAGDRVEITVSPGEGTGCSVIAEQGRQRTFARGTALWGVDSVEAAEAQFRSREQQQQALSLMDARLRQLVSKTAHRKVLMLLRHCRPVDALQQQDAERA